MPWHQPDKIVVFPPITLYLGYISSYMGKHFCKQPSLLAPNSLHTLHNGVNTRVDIIQSTVIQPKIVG
jgi:hypothetical protein